MYFWLFVISQNKMNCNHDCTCPPYLKNEKCLFPPINRIVHNALLKFSPCLNKPATHPYRRLVLNTHVPAPCPCGNLPDLDQDCWLATFQDWWNGVTHGPEARLRSEHNVLVHCHAGKWTHLQQCCGSVVAAPPSATCIDSTASCFCSRLNKTAFGTASFDTASETMTDLLKLEYVHRRRLAPMSHFLFARVNILKHFVSLSGKPQWTIFRRWKQINSVLCSENLSSSSCKRSRQLN